MTKPTLCLLAAAALSMPGAALADDPVGDFLSRVASDVRASIEDADDRGWHNETRGGRDDDRDDDDDDDRGGDDDDGDDDSDDD